MPAYRFRFALLLLALLLKSCEVPDVQPFAQATVAMSTAIEASLRHLTADAALVDSSAATALTPGQQAAFRASQDSLQQIARAYGTVTVAFRTYAQALNQVVEAQERRAQAIDHVAQAVEGLATVTIALGAVPAVAKVVAAPIARLSHDLSELRALHGLSRLVSARQDSLVQHTTLVLQASLGQFARIDYDLNAILLASRPLADTHTAGYYRASQALQALVANQLQLLTSAQVAVLAQQADRLPTLLDALQPLEARADPAGLLRQARARAEATSPPRYQLLLPALAQRKDDYLKLSVLPQAQYDAAQARRARYQARQAQGEAALQQSARLLDLWAGGHHDLRLQVLRARRVPPQELLDQAHEIQQLVADLRKIIQ